MGGGNNTKPSPSLKEDSCFVRFEALPQQTVEVFRPPIPIDLGPSSGDKKIMLRFVSSFRSPDTGHILDPHLLMRVAYEFWDFGGTWGCIKERLIDVMKVLVLSIAVFVVGFMVDWGTVTTCASEEACKTAALIHPPSFQTVPGAHSFAALMVLLSSLATLLFEVKRLAETVYLSNEMHDLLFSVMDCGDRTPFHWLLRAWFRLRAASSGHEELPLPSETPFLSDLSWSEFLHILCTTLQGDRSFRHRREEFDELRAVQSLMVYDNYYIALYQSLLNPEQYRGFGGPAITLIDPFMIRYLLQSLFDEMNNLDVMCDQGEVLRNKLFRVLVLYWVFYPFAVAFYVVKIVIKNVAAVKTRPTEYIEKHWSPKAWWTFRLYNEVPHVTNERLAHAQEAANRMLANVGRSSAVSELVERITGTMIVVILFFAALNPPVIMGGVVAGKTLFFWLSTGFLVYGFIHTNTRAARDYDHKRDLKQLCHYLHYFRREWYVSASRWAAAFQWDYYHSRIYLILAAGARTVVMPLILLKLYYDDSIPKLIEFIQNNSSRVDGVGCMARDADFRDEHLDTPRGNRGDDSSADRFKWEKSVASFASVYPQWTKGIMADDTNRFGIALLLQEVLDEGTTGTEAEKERTKVVTENIPSVQQAATRSFDGGNAMQQPQQQQQQQRPQPPMERGGSPPVVPPLQLGRASVQASVAKPGAAAAGGAAAPVIRVTPNASAASSGPTASQLYSSSSWFLQHAVVSRIDDRQMEAAIQESLAVQRKQQRHSAGRGETDYGGLSSPVAVEMTAQRRPSAHRDVESGDDEEEAD